MNAADLGAFAIENALYDVEDPELGINIVDLGLVRGVQFDPATRTARVRMTLTARACPAGEALVAGVRRRLAQIAGVAGVEVELTFDPPWTPDAITPAGRARLEG